MEQTKALNALAPFLALTKSASSPRAAADLINRATSAPNTYVFAELLSTTQIQALQTSEEYSAHLTLLKIFSYGTYADYQSEAGLRLPELNEAQLLKIRQLSFLSLAKSPDNLSYEKLLPALGLETKRELEDLVISTIYAGLVNAQLDPHSSRVDVSSVSPLRDIQPNSITSMLSTLSEWSSRCTSTLSDLERQIASIKAEALKRHKEEKEWEKHLEDLSEEKENKNSGNANTNQGHGDDGGNGKGKGKEILGGIMGSSFGGVGRKLGLGQGAASKRGNGALDGEDEDEGVMDLDEDDADVVEGRGGSRQAKKRGLGLGSARTGN